MKYFQIESTKVSEHQQPRKTKEDQSDLCVGGVSAQVKMY